MITPQGRPARQPLLSAAGCLNLAAYAGDQDFAAGQAGRFPVQPPAFVLQAQRRVQVGANSGDQSERVFRHGLIEDAGAISNDDVAVHKGGKEQRVNTNS
jgi:hypothetical protein